MVNARPWGARLAHVVGGAVAAFVLVAARPCLAADGVAQCIAANERSIDLRKAGKLLDARGELAACAAQTCPDVIQVACRARMAEINAAIPSVVFDVRDAGGRDREDALVGIDGRPPQPVGVASFPLDPGRHTVRIEGAGNAPIMRELVLREAEKERRERFVLEPLAEPVAAPGPLAPPAPVVPLARTSSSEAPRAAVAPDPKAPPSLHEVVSTTGLVLGGLGIAAIATGGVMALVAKSNYDGARHCAPNGCDQAGLDTRNAAMELGDAATTVFVAGMASLAAGVIVWLAAPPRAPGGAHLALGITAGPRVALVGAF